MERGFRLHPEQASTVAPQIDGLYFYLVLVSAFFTILIFVLIVYFAIRYRRRAPDEIPRPVLGSVRLEILWSAIPLAFVLSFFFWGARLYFSVYSPPDHTLDIHIIGRQWMWKAQHPNGMREINNLHVPVGTPVKLIIASQDVIHSYFIPAFRVKVDAVPGRYTVMWFQATQVGRYRIFCAEYCGTLHSDMIGEVIVMEPDRYQAWLTGNVIDEPPTLTGARLFTSLGCLTCHGTQAPSLAGVYGSTRLLADGRSVTADEHYIRESILDSTAKIVAGYQPIMPSYRGQLTEEQIAALVAYIKSLSDEPGQPAPAGLPELRPVAPEGTRPGGPMP